MKMNMLGVIIIISVFLGILFIGGVATLPLYGDHEHKYYPDPHLISVERAGQIVQYLNCERISLNYPGLTNRCDVNIGRDTNGNILAAITGTPDNTAKRLFQSNDGGRSWTSISMSPTLGYYFLAFTVLKNNHLLLAVKPNPNTITMHLSTDTGKTWQQTTAIQSTPHQYIGEGFQSMTQKKNGEILFPICLYNDDPYNTGVHGSIFISNTGGASFPTSYATGGFWMESHILELQSGKLLMAIRYQRTRQSTDTDQSILALGGSIDPDDDFVFKHIFLADSEDGGITWKNFRPIRDKNNHFLMKYGQCHGQLVQVKDGRVVLLHDNRYESEERDVRARVSKDNGQTWESETYYISFGRGDPASVVLEDDTIVTVTGNWRHGPTGPIGSSTAQAIRWKLPALTSNKSITVISPTAASVWAQGSTPTIRWTFTGSIPTVKIELIKGSATPTVVSSCITNTSSFIWTIPTTISPASNYKIRVSDCANLSIYGDSPLFTIGQPSLFVTPTRLTFGASGQSIVSPPQEILINNTGTGTLNWSITQDCSWLTCTPTSGTNNAIITVSTNPAGLAVGTYTATITISATNAIGSPAQVPVTLNVYNPGAASTPFGYFDSPLPGTLVEGSVPFTGWALDSIGIKDVKIYLEDNQTLVYIGDGVFVNGARPDVENSFPGYPQSNKAGWGYMMLTNFLPRGNGTFTFFAIATNWQGVQVTLDTRTITVDNAHATIPFGTIDTPSQGGTVSGQSFYNFGWALTPQPKKIDISGQTINVYVDGVYLGHPVYNQYRSDIAELFPTYANSGGAVGYFKLDTSKYQNGIHTIQWSARDDGNITGGIGSRYFSIQNSSSVAPQMNTHCTTMNHTQIQSLPSNTTEKRKIKELERIEIFPGNHATFIDGYMIMGNTLTSFPIGSTIQARTFSWFPGPGFIGQYQFLFLIRDRSGEIQRKDMIIEITPFKNRK